jgi:hypothetical protein
MNSSHQILPSDIIPPMSSKMLRSNRRWRGSVFACSILACGIVAFGQAADSPQDITKQFASTAYTHCGDSYFSGPFERPIFACGEARGPVKKCQVFVEARGTGIDYKIDPISAADQMDEVESRFHITFSYSAYRARFQADGKLFEWGPSGQPNKCRENDSRSAMEEEWSMVRA